MKVLSIIHTISHKSSYRQYINNQIWAALNLEFKTMVNIEELLIENPINYEGLASYIKENNYNLVLLSNQRYITMDNEIYDRFKRQIHPAILIESESQDTLAGRIFSDNPFDFNPNDFIFEDNKSQKNEPITIFDLLEEMEQGE